MGVFNYPPDPEPTNVVYFKERKLKAREIDPGIQIAEEVSRRNHPSNVNGGTVTATTRRSRTHGQQTDHAGSPDDSFISWLFRESGR